MLLPFTPLLAALSASSPIFKGKLSDVDLRWTVISQSVDCRTPEECDPLSPKYVPKSRYSSMNHYISKHQYVKDSYFDTVQYKVNPAHMELLTKKGGLDDRLAFHVASLFVRDPIPTYDHEHTDEGYSPKETTAHFENL
jgi:glutamate--cysteine ligase catalytic subunit